VVAAPTLVPGWADGDLLVGTAEETTLIDVKTVISVTDPDRVGRWLWQILAYAWLGTHDLHRIRSVGLYLARHGAPSCRGAEHLRRASWTPTCGTRTHEQFLALARRAIRAEGGQFPIA